MANGKNSQQLEQTARNLCQNMGIDFDQSWQQFQNNMGGSMFGGRR